MRLFQTNPWTLLKMLLPQVDAGRIVLPEFQRDFVWNPKNTWELLLSLSRSFPAGSLLFLKYSKNVLAHRVFEGAEKAKTNGVAPTHLVLDGQQRLTSLYQAFAGKGEHRFWVNLKDMINNDASFEEALIYDRLERFEKRVKDYEDQYRKKILPLSVLFNDEMPLDRWIDNFIDYHREKGDDVRDKVRKIRDEYLEPMRTYEFPVIELNEDTDLEAVCLIFETVNTTGIQLTIFELLTARYWPLGIDLRQLWERALEEYPIMQEFEVEPVTLLQIVALLASEKTPTCKRKHLLNIEGKQLTELWPVAAQALNSALQVLKNECGVISPKWLPYSTLLPGMAAILSKVEAKNGPARGDALRKVKKWLWTSVFSQRYDATTDEKNAQDFVNVVNWINGGSEPEIVTDFSFEPKLLRSINRQRNAVYRGIFCLLVRDGSLDFHTGQKITTQLILDENIEDHHVFPRKYLEKKGVSADEINCILNRTLIDGKTNRTISNKAPSKYLGDIEKVLGSKKLKGILESHLLPEPDHASFKDDNFPAFTSEREKIFAHKIEEAISG